MRGVKYSKKSRTPSFEKNKNKNDNKNDNKNQKITHKNIVHHLRSTLPLGHMLDFKVSESVAPNKVSEKIILKDNGCHGYLMTSSQSAKMKKTI